MLSMPYMIWLHFYIQTSTARYPVEMVHAWISCTIVLCTHRNTCQLCFKRIGIDWLYLIHVPVSKWKSDTTVIPCSNIGIQCTLNGDQTGVTTKCVDFKFKHNSQDQTKSHNATLLIPSCWWSHTMATCGPHELHGTCSTIMPLETNTRATCSPQVALSLSLIHA